MTAQLTPIADYIYLDNDKIDPQKDRTAYTELLRPDGSDMYDHATELPDTFYAVVVSKETKQAEYLHLFTGKEIVMFIRKCLLNRSGKRRIMPIFFPAASAAGDFHEVILSSYHD